MAPIPLEIAVEITQILFVVVLSPALFGWIGLCRALLSNRAPAGVLQPYRDLGRLFGKESVIPEQTSFLFGFVPYGVFGGLSASALFIPFLWPHPVLSPVGDAIVLVGLFSLVRMFMAFGAMDAGTPFGDIGARREMMVAFLAEPSTLMVLFSVSLLSHSTELPSIMGSLMNSSDPFQPSLVFASLAFVLILLGENARLPIDNPSTHLELTMIHEAMILEYSGPLLAMMEWGSQLRLVLYLLIGISFFFPWGMSMSGSSTGFLLSMVFLLAKLAVAGAGLAVIETLFAKLRIFRVPEFMAMAYLLAVIGFLIHFVLEV